MLVQYLRVLRKIQFYEAQGVTVMPNARVPILGNLIDLSKYQKAVEESPEPIVHHKPWLLTKFAKTKGDERFDGKKYPIVLLNVQNTVQLYVTDPEIVQEFMTVKN